MLRLSFSLQNLVQVRKFMADNHFELIVNTKNQWLKSHVDVQYPTPESVQGCQRYFAQMASVTCVPFIPSHDTASQDGVMVYPVDFHRLTVVFAQLQSGRFDAQEQPYIIEFLTQIIYSAPCTLYLGFVNGEAIWAAIVTRMADAVLVSDIAVDITKTSLTQVQVAQCLVDFLQLDMTAGAPPIFIEH